MDHLNRSHGSKDTGVPNSVQQEKENRSAEKKLHGPRRSRDMGRGWTAARVPLAGLLAGRGLLCPGRPKRFPEKKKKRTEGIDPLVVVVLRTRTGTSGSWPGMMPATETALRRRAAVGEEAGARGGRRFEHGRLGHGGGPGGHGHDTDGTVVGNRAEGRSRRRGRARRGPPRSGRLQGAGRRR